MKLRSYIMPVLWIVVIAAITQYIFIASIPNLIFAIAKHRSAVPLNMVIHPGKTDASLRRVVLPNPDFMYLACFYDVSGQDLIISGQFPDSSHYCSLAFYGSDIQPYYVVNNLERRPGAYQFKFSAKDNTNNSTSIHAKTKQGCVLMRILVTDSADKVLAEQIIKDYKVEAK